MFFRVRNLLLLSLTLFCACVWCPGEIEEGMPHLRDKLPLSTKVYLAGVRNGGGIPLKSRQARAVEDVFKAALASGGIEVKTQVSDCATLERELDAAASKQCDVALFIRVLAWNYGEAGFSGFGNRDEVLLSVMLINSETRRVITRAKLHITNGIGRSAFGGNRDSRQSLAPMINKYVNTLFAR